MAQTNPTNLILQRVEFYRHKNPKINQIICYFIENNSIIPEMQKSIKKYVENHIVDSNKSVNVVHIHRQLLDNHVTCQFTKFSLQVFKSLHLRHIGYPQNMSYQYCIDIAQKNEAFNKLDNLDLDWDFNLVTRKFSPIETNFVGSMFPNYLNSLPFFGSNNKIPTLFNNQSILKPFPAPVENNFGSSIFPNYSNSLPSFNSSNQTPTLFDNQPILQPFSTPTLFNNRSVFELFPTQPKSIFSSVYPSTVENQQSTTSSPSILKPLIDLSVESNNNPPLENSNTNTIKPSSTRSTRGLSKRVITDDTNNEIVKKLKQSN